MGSSTVKAYFVVSNQIPKSFVQKSIPFKVGFDPERGIAESNKNELLDLIHSIRESNQGVAVKTYATGIFRKFTSEARMAFVDDFFIKTGLFLTLSTMIWKVFTWKWL